MCAASEPVKAFALPRELTRSLRWSSDEEAMSSTSKTAATMSTLIPTPTPPSTTTTMDNNADEATTPCADVERLEAAMRFLLTFFRPLFVAETNDRLALIDSEHGSHFPPK